MNWFKCALGLVLLVGLMGPEGASADRGRDGHSFQPRHEAFQHRQGGFRHRDDFVRHRGSTFSHGRDVLRHPERPLRVRRGHHHGHSRSHLGLYIGVPLFWNAPAPYYAYPPSYYAYPPPVVAVPSPPTVYIERGHEEAAPTRDPAYWYYCHSPEGYYPYVRECPGEWERVAPTPPR